VSQALVRWRADRTARLIEIDGQCAACLSANRPAPQLADENLRAYAVLLSGHFQGFCRDLDTECALVVASKVRTRLQPLVQEQFAFHLSLDHGNPTHANIKKDFERFGFKLGLETADAANPLRLNHLSQLIEWRNVAAHQSNRTPGVALTLHTLRGWRNSCDGLAVSLDAVMYNRLRTTLRRSPWVL
jgi:RiboL-PSP-HEPN